MTKDAAPQRRRGEEALADWVTRKLETRPEIEPLDGYVSQTSPSSWSFTKKDGWVAASLSRSPEGIVNGAHDGTEEGKRAWAHLCAISARPEGGPMTYGEIAEAAGAGPCLRCVGKAVVGPGELSPNVDALQAKIDALMLEYCPDEMTPAQIENWKAHQQAVSPEEEAKIKRALATRPETLPPSDSGREGRSAIMDRAIYHRMLTNLCTMILGSSVPIGPMRRREDYPPELARAINWLKDVQDREAARRAEGRSTDG